MRERFDKLVKEFKCKEATESRASGVDVEFTQRDKAMTDILERMSECEMTMDSQKQKEKQERETAEEMRRRATERFSETRKRQSGEGGSKNDDQVTPEKKQRRGSSEVLDVLKESLQLKKNEQENAQSLKEREMEMMERQFTQQKEFQRSMMEQQ